MKSVGSAWQTLLHSREFTGLLLVLALLCFSYQLFASLDSMLMTLLALFVPWGAVIALLRLSQERRKPDRSTESAETEESEHA